MPTLERSAFKEAEVHKFLGEWFFNWDPTFIGCGWYDDQNENMGGGLQFIHITIPQGSTINVAYITFTADASDDVNIVRTKIVGEAVDSAAGFSTLANYQARRGTEVGGANNDNRTVAEVLWDGIGAWVHHTDYNSPEIKTVIQEIVDRDGWVSDNDLVVWWDDHAGRSTTSHPWTVRFAELNSKLHIEYTPPPLPVEERYFAWII